MNTTMERVNSKHSIELQKFTFAPKAILFDLDGTLADTALDLGGVINAMRIARDMPVLDIQNLRKLASSGARGLLKSGFNLTPDDAQYAAYQEEFLNQYEQRLCQETILFDGIVDMIKALHARQIAWGVVTNKSKRFTDPLMQEIIKRYDLPLAGSIVSGDSTAHSKPHPLPLQYAAEQLNLACNDIVYVGDDLRDIQAGKAACMPTVAVRYGYIGEHALESWDAEYVISQPMQLIDLLP